MKERYKIIVPGGIILIYIFIIIHYWLGINRVDKINSALALIGVCIGLYNFIDSFSSSILRRIDHELHEASKRIDRFNYYIGGGNEYNGIEAIRGFINESLVIREPRIERSMPEVLKILGHLERAVNLSEKLNTEDKKIYVNKINNIIHDIGIVTSWDRQFRLLLPEDRTHSKQEYLYDFYKRNNNV